MMPDSIATSPLVRKHQMPFGVNREANGSMVFHLWAPQAQSVDLCLYGKAWEAGQAPCHIMPMQSLAGGWYQIETGDVKTGDLYHFRINQTLLVPDPASRYQPYDVHGPSEVIDPAYYSWQDSSYKGRPWHEAIFYELHTGTYTPEGTFKSLINKLDYLQQLGITAIELMPVSDFPGRWNWGYDGVLPFAPDSVYGRPDDLKALIDTAHQKNMMVFLDVVYNHFGPEGNYLHAYAESFFNKKHTTPWGAAINLDGDNNHWVRQFFIQNALYWLEEFHFDGLRLDAVHALCDDSGKYFLTELTETVEQHFTGSGRYVHLVLENDANEAGFLKHPPTCAQWNDDFHHTAHILLTGEEHGYYADYRTPDRDPVDFLGRCMTEGFAYQGEISAYRNNKRRGESSTGLPLTAFVNFLQNHDQIGNRAFGERLCQLSSPAQLKAMVSVCILAPGIPLLFMGEEFGCEQPFLFFCDLGPDLRPLVTEGRRKEFAAFPQFSDPETIRQIPDPCHDLTFQKTVLDWSRIKSDWHLFYQSLLKIRRTEIIPRLSKPFRESIYRRQGEKSLACEWVLADNSLLSVCLNLGETPCIFNIPEGRILHASRQELTNKQPTSFHAGDVVWILNTEVPRHDSTHKENTAASG